MTLALAGTAVLQDGDGTAIAFAGRMLASYGAEVIEVASAGPVAERTESDERQRKYLALGKRRAAIETENAAGREFLAAFAGVADIVLTERTRAEWDALGAASAAKAAVSVTPWGSEGPPAMRHAGDLLQYHGGGLGSITPRFANNPEEPPLRLGYPISDFLTGLNAAVTALAAFAEASASGTPIVADVSGQQAIAFAMGLYSVFPAYEGRAVSRVSRPELAPYHFLPCRDGWVMVICPEQHQWQSLMELMGSPAWSQSELFDTSGGRAENWDAIEPFLVEWLQDRDAADIYVAAQARRIPLAPVSGPAALLESPQLQHRAFFERAAIGGREVRVPGVPFASEPVLAKAPESGESSFTIFDARMAGAQGARAPRP